MSTLIAPKPSLKSPIADLLADSEKSSIPIIQTVVDTEFTSHLEYIKGFGRSLTQYRGKSKNRAKFGRFHKAGLGFQCPRTPIFSQIKFIGDQTSYALINSQFEESINAAATAEGLAPYPLYSEEPTACLLAEGLRLKGHEVNLREKSVTEHAKPLIWEIQAYFATAEIAMLGEYKKGSVKARIQELLRSRGENRIASGKRIKAIGNNAYVGRDCVSLDHIIEIDGEAYELFLSIRDYGAIVGNGGLKNWAEVVGYEFPSKDELSKTDMIDMVHAAITKPKETHAYIFGDIDLDLIWGKYTELFTQMLERLEIEGYKGDPSMTIGQTVADVLLRKLAKAHSVSTEGNWKEAIANLMTAYTTFNAQGLAKKWDSSESYLSKTDGGRAFNARCKDTAIWNALCDIDISGCYGEGQRNQSLVIGCDPVVIRYYHKNRNQKMSLRSLFKMVGVKVAIDEKGDRYIEDWGELVPGLFYGRISGNLKYPQNLIASWFDVDKNAIRDMGRNPYHDEVFDEEKGTTKILLNQIRHGVITSDVLEVLVSHTSKRQFNDLIHNLKIDVFSYYPKSEQIEVEVNSETGETDYVKANFELRKRYDNYQYRSTCHVTNKGNCKHQVVNIERECRAWYAIPMDSLITDQLLIERKIAKKEFGKKSPMQTMLKLMVNTLYGDLVSPYFVFSNPIVGNNITARARVLAWSMEAGLYSRQSITDGGAFILNKVMHLTGHSRSRTIEMEKIAELWHRSQNGEFKADSNQRKWLQLAPLGGSEFTIEKTEFVSKQEKDKGTIYTNYELIREGEVVGYKKWVWNDDKQTHFPVTDWSWIDREAMKHLQQLFPRLTVLNAKSTEIVVNDDNSVTYRPRVGQFSFETKDVYPDGGVFRSTADYLMKTPDEQIIKARSHQVKKDHLEISNRDRDFQFDDIDNGRIVKHNGYKTSEPKLGQGISMSRKDGVAPARLFLEALYRGDGQGGQNNAVPRASVVVREGILKVGAYKERLKGYQGCGLVPGDSELKAMLFTEFSLSQFVYKTISQYKGWEKAIAKSKDSYGQSIEAWFLNDDGTLRYQEMLDWAGDAIANGVSDPIDKLRRDRPLDDEERKHPGFDTLQEVRLILKLPYWHEDISGSKKSKWTAGEVKNISASEVIRTSTGQTPEVMAETPRRKTSPASDASNHPDRSEIVDERTDEEKNNDDDELTRLMMMMEGLE